MTGTVMLDSQESALLTAQAQWSYTEFSSLQFGSLGYTILHSKADTFLRPTDRTDY